VSVVEVFVRVSVVVELELLVVVSVLPSSTVVVVSVRVSVVVLVLVSDLHSPFASRWQSSAYAVPPNTRNTMKTLRPIRMGKRISDEGMFCLRKFIAPKVPKPCLLQIFQSQSQPLLFHG